MTEQTQPTDEEIKELIPDGEEWKYGVGFPEAIRFARAVLAKWGTPAGAGEVVAWVDERAISWLKNSRSRAASITTQLTKERLAIRPMPLYTATPQPTQAQAGAVPLTNQQLVACIKAAGFKTWDSRMWALKREIENSHGIKGADHER